MMVLDAHKLGEVMLRASLGTALALLGVLGATAAGTLTANASPADAPAADTFSFVPSAEPPGHPEDFSVIVDSPSTLVGLTAHFLTGAGADAYDPTLTQFASETDPNDATQTQTTWTATIPVGASGLALGSYTINLTGTFADSASYTLSGVAPFSFDATSAVTLAATRTHLSYPYTETALSGTVTLTNPDGTADTDYTGLTLSIVRGGQDLEYLSVASDGTFTDPNFAPPASESVVAEVTGNGIESSQSVPVPLTVTSTTPTLKLKVNPVTETYGLSATVIGTLSYPSGATGAPVSGQEIWIGRTAGASGSPLATGKTGAGGGFSIRLPTLRTGTTLYVGTTPQSNLNAVETPLRVNVVNPTVISGLKASLNQHWTLSVSGCLAFGIGNTTQRFYNTSGLTVQYASATRGPWKNLFAINRNEDASCGTGGVRFTGSHEAPLNYAYYRVVYAGTTGATSYAATTSNTVLTWRYYDRITGFKVSPATVNVGGKLTVKGTLQYYYYGWHNYSGQLIWINLRPKGSSTWYWMVKVKTNSKGQFSATFQDPISATWQAEFQGNNSNGVGHLSFGSPEVYVRLK
jgi:hypothetical protein